MTVPQVKVRRPDGQLRFGLMWFNSQTPYLTSAVAAKLNPPVLDVRVQTELAQAAEEVGFDFLFMADGYIGHGEANNRIGHGEPRLSAPIWAPVLMNATKHIGVATTLHTRYMSPAVIARMGANLDTMSGGRWAWNIVPGTKDDPIMGVDQKDHGARYAQATDAVRAVKALWKARGADVNYDGEFYQLSGSMMGPHPIQDPWPLLFNAGVSSAGQDLIASECDYGFFTVVEDLAKVRKPVEELAAKAVANGRDPLEVNLVGGVSVLTAATTREAEERFAELRETIDMDAARGWLDSFLGRSQTYLETHSGERDEAARSIGVGSGAKPLIGTPEDVAEQILEINRETGLRGFQILPMTWSTQGLLDLGRMFTTLEKADAWTAPANRGWSW